MRRWYAQTWLCSAARPSCVQPAHKLPDLPQSGKKKSLSEQHQDLDSAREFSRDLKVWQVPSRVTQMIRRSVAGDDDDLHSILEEGLKRGHIVP